MEHLRCAHVGPDTTDMKQKKSSILRVEIKSYISFIITVLVSRKIEDEERIATKKYVLFWFVSLSSLTNYTGFAPSIKCDSKM